MLKSVSFVIPALNGAATIGGCLNSIVCLSYPQELIEIIVVDNGSSDGTTSIAHKFPNVKVIIEPRRGRSYARNTGWKAAKHDLIAFIDCDVCLEKQWLRFMLKQFISPKFACAQGKITPVSINEKQTLFEKFRLYNKNGNTQFTLIETILPHKLFPIINTASCIYRKHVLVELNGFDTTLVRAEDVDLSVRASRAGYIISYNDMALSYVYWDLGGFYSYLKREISHAYYFIILKRKFYSQRESILTNLGNLKYTIQSVLRLDGALILKLIRLFFKVTFYIIYLIYDFALKLNSVPLHLQGKSCFKITFENNMRHTILRKIASCHRKMRDPLTIKGLTAHPDTRIVISNNRVIFLNTLYQQTAQYTDEAFYFLRSFILDDDYFINTAGEEAFQSLAQTLIPQLFDLMLMTEEFDSSKICLNPFIVIRRLINEDDEPEGFSFAGGRAYRGTEETQINRMSKSFTPIIHFFEKQLAKKDWFDGISANLPPESFPWLCHQEIITDKLFFKNILEKSFNLENFLKYDAEFKKNKINSIPTDIKLAPALRDQLTGRKQKFDIFKSHIKQLNNLLSFSDSIYWIEPWSFHHPMPVFLTDELKNKLIHFNVNDWTDSELKDLLDSGILVSSDLQDLPIDIAKLSEQFKTTKAFYAPQSTSAYLTWSMGQYLRFYFETNLIKMGDVQCADRRAVYDSPLCLHVQDGMAKLINRVLPFKVKSSFNYSVCYYQYADLYPHKDRPEAPYSMSFTLAAYEGENRSHYQNILGFEDDGGVKTEIKLSDGDIALFNGFELTHYRHLIAKNHSLYVIVMHFVSEDFTGNIG